MHEEMGTVSARKAPNRKAPAISSIELVNMATEGTISSSAIATLLNMGREKKRREDE